MKDCQFLEKTANISKCDFSIFNLDKIDQSFFKIILNILMILVSISFIGRAATKGGKEDLSSLIDFTDFKQLWQISPLSPELK